MSTTRNTSGKFSSKSEHPRKIRSVNLTDKAWQWLADVAGKSGISRNDYLEAMAEGCVPLIETVSVEIKPLIETVQPEPSPLMEAVSVESKPIMETVEPESKPIMETVKSDYDALLESSARVTNNLKEEVQRLRSQLDVQKADWDELLRDFENSEAVRGDLGLQMQMLQSELETIKSDRSEIQESVPAVADFPEPSDLLNQLRTRRKKSRAELVDVEIILELLPLATYCLATSVERQSED